MASKESKTEIKKSRRQRDDKEDTRSTKRVPESEKNESGEVHSANSWEKVDLGGDDRKSKFLRLMGASKKEHHGRFVIGDSRTEHGRSKEEVEKLTEDLEEQYEQGIGLVLTGAARRHKGLGFQETDEEDQPSGTTEDPVQEEPAPKPEEKPEEEDRPKKKKPKKDKNSCDGDEEAKSEKTDDKAKSKPMLGFVKSSSS